MLPMLNLRSVVALDAAIPQLGALLVGAGLTMAVAGADEDWAGAALVIG